MSTDRYNGQVKFFNRDRGFGFITRLSDNKDFFVHYLDIKPSTQCWNILYQNEYVEFSTRDGPNGEQAGDVTGINGGSLLCEAQFKPAAPASSNNKKRRKPLQNNVQDQSEFKIQKTE